MKTPVMIALDFESVEELQSFLKQFPSHLKLTVKIGMELFYGQGPQIVRNLRQKGHAVFLDLKLHDIPNTVEKAMFQLGKLGIQYTTIHALGGKPMIQATKRGLMAGARAAKVPVPKLLAVTELTSISERQLQEEQNVPLKMNEQVQKLAQLAESAGADGVICSPHKVAQLKSALPADFLYVTPGIRMPDAKKDDQQRVMTPAEAQKAGSSALVVGRPITKAADPVVAYQRIVESMQD
ncbi:orotidine-5'-phosphate decarboxylase [Pediococcus acidilactici]|uniref:orotidine-5'-phosphate decarboxylase n=1 Tax=Pediococcus acidilactici TaxID=1254 RepID=UPI001C707CE3|nr:orotidine-5'-phosphate decarboxylase [Pediococcus acidilactici]MBW9300497.1 orotidine-5'-phosphate decarboxylase [Pediococcus acidilactici]